MSDSTSPFIALQHRNFRLLWTGQIVSVSGSMMQIAAILWHVSLLASEQKGLALGLVGLVRVVPIVVFSLIGGVLADAYDRRKVMLVTQAGMALVAAMLALITLRPGRGLADLPPGRAEFGGRRVRQPGAAVALPEPGAA